MNIMVKLSEWADKLDALAPHASRVATRADMYACAILDALGEIEDLLRGEGETEGTLVKTLALTNGNAQQVDVRNDADWSLLTVVVEHPSANTVVLLTQAGITRYAYEGAAAKTDMPTGVILARGTELTAVSTGGDVKLTIYAKACKRKRQRAVMPRFDPREAAIGAQETTDPDRHFTDEATHIPITHPDDLGVPLDAGESRKIPFPPYEG